MLVVLTIVLFCSVLVCFVLFCFVLYSSEISRKWGMFTKIVVLLDN
jgi:hypothetical protein